MSHVPRVGDWVARPRLEDEGPLLVVALDPPGMFRARHWLTDRGWSSSHLGLYPVESAFGWLLVDPPVGLPDQCRAIFGRYDPFFCGLPLQHEGKHRDEGDNYVVEWGDG